MKAKWVPGKGYIIEPAITKAKKKVVIKKKNQTELNNQILRKIEYALGIKPKSKKSKFVNGSIPSHNKVTHPSGLNCKQRARLKYLKRRAERGLPKVHNNPKKRLKKRLNES